jgi:hypothetical protein
MMDLALFDSHDPTIGEGWAKTATWVLGRLFAFKSVEVRFEDGDRIGREPSILACNATHQYDVVPIRYGLRVAGHDVTTLSKGKNYHGLAIRTASAKWGSIPLVSRGYIIVMDFQATFARKPSDSEYHAIRAYIDNGVPLPEGEVFEVVAGRARSVLGLPFNPSESTYRSCAHALYREMMGRTLGLCRRAIAQGYSLQMFPQGSSATRLSKGHIGAVQLARALHQPLLPIGVNGCLDVFPGRGRFAMAPGTVLLRVGEPFVPDLTALPDDFESFHPEHERLHHAVLEAQTALLMERINDLLDARYQWAPDQQSDGAAGTRRFT